MRGGGEEHHPSAPPLPNHLWQYLDTFYIQTGNVDFFSDIISKYIDGEKNSVLRVYINNVNKILGAKREGAKFYTGTNKQTNR